MSMNRLKDNLKQNISAALPVIIAYSFISGALLSSALACTRYAFLLFPTVLLKVSFVAFVAAFFVLICTALFFPFIVITALFTGYRRVRVNNPGQYYASGYCAFLFCAGTLLWLHCVVYKAGMSAIVFLIDACVILFFSAVFVRFNFRKRRTHPRKSVRYGASFPIGALAGCIILLAASRGFLSAGLPAEKKPQEALSVAEYGDVRGEPYHIILISLDALRQDHVSCYGYHRETTLALDALAGEGTLFLNAFAQSPWTLPSHATVLTGLYPSSHKADIPPLFTGLVKRLDGSMHTMAEILSHLGYATAAFTSSVYVSGTYGLDRGFDVFEYDRRKEHTAEVIVTKACDYLARRKEKPFFLFLHFFDIHDYASPEPFDVMYVDPSYDGTLAREKRYRVGSDGYYYLSDADLAFLKAKYDGAARYVDMQLERFFQKLKSLGLYDTSFIIVFSDHGEEFWEHKGTGHGFTLYDEQLRIPLIIKVPKKMMQAGGPGTVETNTGLIDILPTLLDYLGADTRSAGFQGITLKGLIEGKEPLRKERFLFAEAAYLLNKKAVLGRDATYINNQLLSPYLLRARLFLLTLRSIFSFKANESYHYEKGRRESGSAVKKKGSAARDLDEKLVTFIQRYRGTGRKAEGLEPLDSDTKRHLRSLGYL
jgi:arylsulfatase A-like enzyme